MGKREYAEEVHAHCRFGQAFVWDDEGEGGQGGEGAYPMELHGVVYRITLRDWELIVHSEVCCALLISFFLCTASSCVGVVYLAPSFVSSSLCFAMCCVVIQCSFFLLVVLVVFCFSSFTKSREQEEMQKKLHGSRFMVQG